jgi:hypothetical protein
MVIYAEIDYAAQPNDLSSPGKAHMRVKKWAFPSFDFGMHGNNMRSIDTAEKMPTKPGDLP